jgi:hypothetical protein
LEESVENWFLLFGGSSTSGRGVAEFVKRTTDIKVAKAHLSKIEACPYSFGYVTAYIKDNEMYFKLEEDLDSLV